MEFAKGMRHLRNGEATRLYSYLNLNIIRQAIELTPSEQDKIREYERSSSFGDNYYEIKAMAAKHIRGCPDCLAKYRKIVRRNLEIDLLVRERALTQGGEVPLTEDDPKKVIEFAKQSLELIDLLELLLKK